MGKAPCKEPRDPHLRETKTIGSINLWLVFKLNGYSPDTGEPKLGQLVEAVTYVSWFDIHKYCEKYSNSNHYYIMKKVSPLRVGVSYATTKGIE